MFTLLNKKKFGMANYFAGFLFMLFTPFVLSIKMLDESGAAGTEDADKTALLSEITKKVTKLIGDSRDEDSDKTAKAIQKEVKSINDAIKKLSSEQIDTLKASVDELIKNNKELESALKIQGTEMAKLKNISTEKPEKDDLKKALRDGIMQYKDSFLNEVSDVNGTRLSMRKYFEKGNQKSPEFQIKVAVDMLQSAISQNYVNQYRLTELVPGMVGIPLTIYPHVLDYFPQRNISRPYMAMLVAYSYEDGAATKIEGSASGQSSFLLKTVMFPAFALYTYFTLSDETLDDLEEVISEVGRVAPSKIKDLLDTKIYRDAGNGTSDIMGLFVNGTTCTDFDTTDYADSVVGANYIDLIEAMVLDCELNKRAPDTVGLNPIDVRLHFNSLKNQLDDSVRDNRVTFVNGKLTSICGLNVRVSSAITVNTCFVGAVNELCLLGIRKSLSLEIGLNGTDFVEGQKTARIGMRVAFGVGDPTGIIYCSDMSTAKDAIKLVEA